MNVLVVTNMFPTPNSPTAGTFIESQIEGLRMARVGIEVLLLDRLKEGMKVYLDVERRLNSTMAVVAPDLVHVMYGGVMAERVTHVVTEKPVVVTFHGSDLQGEPLSVFHRRLLARYGVVCSRTAARRAAGIIVVSKHLERLLPAEIDRQRIRVIPSGIDLDHFRPMNREQCAERLGWNPDVFHVLFASSSGNAIKRPGLAVAAVDELRARGIRVELTRMSGVVSADVPVWLNASDAVLLTSLREGSPTIVKEALACNRPVVSVKVGDVEARIHGIQGCYLSEATPGALAEKLYRVFTEHPRIEGRYRMEALSLEQTARRVAEFYADVLAGRFGALSSHPER